MYASSPFLWICFQRPLIRVGADAKDECTLTISLAGALITAGIHLKNPRGSAVERLL